MVFGFFVGGSLFYHGENFWKEGGKYVLVVSRKGGGILRMLKLKKKQLEIDQTQKLQKTILLQAIYSQQENC